MYVMRLKIIPIFFCLLVSVVSSYAIAEADTDFTVVKNSHTVINSSLCLDNKCPTGTKVGNQIVDHGITILANNPGSKFADWVAYKVEAKYIEGPSRERGWKQDPSLPEDDTLPPSAYKDVEKDFKSDRGHQAPLASFKGVSNYYMVNYLSNITPQARDLNEGAWENLEGAVRKYAASEGAGVYVITGPYYKKDQNPEKVLPHYLGKVMIPEGYFKVIAKKGRKGITASVFIFPQTTPRHANFCDFKETLNQIHKLTGLTIFSEKPDADLNADLGC